MHLADHIAEQPELVSWEEHGGTQRVDRHVAEGVVVEVTGVVKMLEVRLVLQAPEVLEVANLDGGVDGALVVVGSKTGGVGIGNRVRFALLRVSLLGNTGVNAALDHLAGVAASVFEEAIVKFVKAGVDGRSAERAVVAKDPADVGMGLDHLGVFVHEGLGALE